MCWALLAAMGVVAFCMLLLDATATTLRRARATVRRGRASRAE